MKFTSFDFLIFLPTVFGIYWCLLKDYRKQNCFIVVCSYFFYGYVHPLFCLLLFLSTLSDYCCSLGIVRYPRFRRHFVGISIVINLGILFFFKYCGFFVDNIAMIFKAWGWTMSEVTWKVLLPAGISFYTFQTLSYTVDVYRGHLKPTSNFIDFAMYVCFFPQLVAGPIERASRLLPQISSERHIDSKIVQSALFLVMWGFFKKLVIADNVAPYVNQIFLLQDPSLFILGVGAFAFSVQILADFSAYTDIARGCASLLGIELIENFNRPYAAISPSDFWRRWHISLSSWIRDYLYIPLGGSRVNGLLHFFWVVIVTMSLSGLWHGAAWNYVLWGAYHGILLFLYHICGAKGRWKPRGVIGLSVAWLSMYVFTLFGWLLFRTHSVEWLWSSLRNFTMYNDEQFITAIIVLLTVSMYSLPYLLYECLLRYAKKGSLWYSFFAGAALCAIFIFGNENGQDFIYFQF